MKRSVLSLALIAAFFLLQYSTGCKKFVPAAPDNPYGLPNATQTGAGNLSFHMNGSNYFVKNDIYNFDAAVLHDTLAVKGYFDYGHFYGAFYLGALAHASVNTVYDFSDTVHTYCFFLTDSTCLVLARETTVKVRTGSITLTKVDSAKRIVSGVFNANFRVPGCDSLFVAAGRFDCTYRKL